MVRRISGNHKGGRASKQLIITFQHRETNESTAVPQQNSLSNTLTIATIPVAPTGYLIYVFII
jgi:hypothetical protein